MRLQNDLIQITLLQMKFQVLRTLNRVLRLKRIQVPSKVRYKQNPRQQVPSKHKRKVLLITYLRRQHSHTHIINELFHDQFGLPPILRRFTLLQSQIFQVLVELEICREVLNRRVLRRPLM